MTKDIFLLGSTGSIGDTTLNILKKDKKNFKVKLLTTHSNINKIYKQALEFKVNKIVIFNKNKILKNYKKFEKKKIKVYSSINDVFKTYKKKSFLTINAISGIDGLEPSLDIIKYSNNLAVANKESIICGWNFLHKELLKNKTGFIPIDSEHFSIWSLLNHEKKKNIKKIYLTASGGPFLNLNLKKIENINPKYALKHPNWKMGKKISIDSATMMNKIFEVIEAIKIFNLHKNKFEIIIHPKSYIHAIVHYKNGLVEFLAHKTSMEIPIMNSLYMNKRIFNYDKKNINLEVLNGLNFIKPDIKKFPVLKFLSMIVNKPSYFETILITINDFLVERYLRGDISYLTLNTNLTKMIKKPYFIKFYKLEPKNLIDIKTMVEKTIIYLNKIKFNEK
mgnify:CR=1 FL=1